MDGLLAQIGDRHNQHRRTAQLMRCTGLIYTAFIFIYLALVSFGLLGDTTPMLGFVALCFYITLIYLWFAGGFKKYKRHLQLAEQYKSLHKKAFLEGSINESELLLFFNLIAGNDDVIPTIGGRLLACILERNTYSWYYNLRCLF